MVENDFFITWLPCNDPLCVACPAPAYPCRKSCLRDSVGQTAQQFIDRGLRSRLRVDLLDDHRAVPRMRAILRSQLAGHHHAVRRHRTLAHLPGRAVVAARALAEDPGTADPPDVADDHT